MQSQWEDAQAVIVDAVGRCATKPLMVAVGATAYLGVPRALASQGWLSDAAMITIGAVMPLGYEDPCPTMSLAIKQRCSICESRL